MSIRTHSRLSIALASCLMAVAPTVWADPASQPATLPSGASVEAPAAASDVVTVVRVRDQLGQAIALYQRSEFEAAKRLLDALARDVGTERSREAQEIFTYKAFVEVAFGRTEQAISAFERALTIAPELTLAAPSPKIAAAFEQARQRYRARVRALDHDPPALRHQPHKTIKHGTRLEIQVEARDVSPIKRVALNYRISGNRGFNVITMERQGKHQYLASIPGVAVVRPGVEYYIEAWDALGNGPGLKGGAAVPIKVAVQGGPLRPANAATPGAWYRKWWVWAIVAGVAATAGGVAAGIYLGRDERARLDMRIDSALNPPAGASP